MIQNKFYSNFFDVPVGDNGAAYMQRLFSFARWIFGISLVITVLITIYLYVYIRMTKMFAATSGMMYVAKYVTTTHMVLVAILLVVQTFCYRRFRAMGVKTIQTGQEAVFNLAFKWLVRHGIATLVLLIVELINMVFQLFLNIHLLQQAQTAR